MNFETRSFLKVRLDEYLQSIHYVSFDTLIRIFANSLRQAVTRNGSQFSRDF